MGSGSERAKALSESDTPAAPATAAFRKLLRSGSITAEWSPHQQPVWLMLVYYSSPRYDEH
jgi:hypothetical protein